VQLGQRIALREPREERRLARIERRQLGEQGRHLGESVAQRRRLARRQRAEHRAGHQALRISRAGQPLADAFPPRIVRRQRAHG
jgi:hypothetical protein